MSSNEAPSTAPFAGLRELSSASRGDILDVKITATPKRRKAFRDIFMGNLPEIILGIGFPFRRS